MWIFSCLETDPNRARGDVKPASGAEPDDCGNHLERIEQRGIHHRQRDEPNAPHQAQSLVDQFMQARRQVGIALKAGDADAERSARATVDEVKCALGERGPLWWRDGTPDFNRKLALNTPYAQWFAALDCHTGAG